MACSGRSHAHLAGGRLKLWLVPSTIDCPAHRRTTEQTVWPHADCRVNKPFPNGFPPDIRERMADIKLTLVVACALVDADKRVLIAQRPQGKALAGLWEFPG